MKHPEHWLGHEGIRRMLTTAFQQNRLSHGYIFDGPAGIGKRSTALWMAALLFCEAREKPCGQCPGCIRLMTDNHPDILVLEPEEGSLKNHQLEAFQAFLRVKPFMGPVRIGIMDDADTMTASAQNRLLKTLEEPAAGTVLFLITTHARRLLPTVLSRCQVLRFQELPSDSIASYLANHYNVDRVRAARLADLAGGSLAKALALTASETVSEAEALVEAWLACLDRGDRSALFELADRYEKTIDWEQALTWLMQTLRERLMRAATEGASQELGRLVRLGARVEEALTALREQANERIVIDVMLLRMQEDYYD